MDRLEDREYLFAIVTEVVGAKAEDGCARSDRARAATTRVVVAVDRDMLCNVLWIWALWLELIYGASPSGVSDL